MKIDTGTFEQPDHQDIWHIFLKKLRTVLYDVVLLSMFESAQCIKYEPDEKKVYISFLKKFMIFQDVLEQQKSLWLCVIEEIFGSGVQAISSFSLEKQPVAYSGKRAHQTSSVPAAGGTPAKPRVESVVKASYGPLAQELLAHFEGTIIPLDGDKI